MGVAKIRRAGPEDLPGIAALLGVRDELPGPHPGAGRAVLDLDPDRIRVWVASDDDRIVAMTCAELRRVWVADGEVPATYWTNLYIHEDYRDQMLYPRLPQTMMRQVVREGLGPVCAGVRRPNVVKGHLRIGFRQVDSLVVRLKPFRPLTLLTKRRGLPPWLCRAAGLADFVAGAPLRLLGLDLAPAKGSVANLVPERDAEVLSEFLADCRRDWTCRRWSPAELRDRLTPAFDGGTYTVIGWTDERGLAGVAVFRTVVREAGIRVGVLMDVAARGDDPAVLRALAREVERRLRTDGVEGLLWLDGLGKRVSGVFRRAGFLDTGERYVTIAGPARSLSDDDPLLVADRWRFSLLEHDAF